MMLPCRSVLPGLAAGLPSLPSATVHGHGPSLHSWGGPRPVRSRCRAPRLLSIISFQLSLQESSRLRGGGRARCWLWQQVNKMCSQLGVSSWPATGHGRKAGIHSVIWLFLLPLPNPSRLDAWRLLGKRAPTLNGVLVINEQVPQDHRLVPRQDNALHKLGPQVLLHPAVL